MQPTAAASLYPARLLASNQPQLRTFPNGSSPIPLWSTVFKSFIVKS